MIPITITITMLEVKFTIQQSSEISWSLSWKSNIIFVNLVDDYLTTINRVKIF